MITIKRHDTGIGIKATLQNENGTVDLTDASVLFLMGEYKIHPFMLDRNNGIVTVEFKDVHTKVEGIYRAEFEVEYSDGRIETFPNDEYIKVKIMEDLGGN